MLQLTGKKNKIIFYIFLFLLLSTLSVPNQNKVKDNKQLLKVELIEVFGLSKSENLKIVSELDIFLSKNIFSLGKMSIKNILDNNSLIESVRIKKIYPNKIRVLIKKTEFLAITNKGDKKFLIGSNGRVTLINNIDLLEKKLPYIFGKVDYKNFTRFKEIIRRSSFEFNQINEFYFFQSERWDIKTADGFLIKLPQKDLFEALQFAYLLKSNEKFKQKKVIDLRVKGKIFNSNE